MKKLLLTIAIVLGLSFGTFAQGGLFGYGAVSDEEYYGASYRGSNPLLPMDHNSDYDFNGTTGDPAPVGSGIAILLGFGAAYLVGKNRSKK